MLMRFAVQGTARETENETYASDPPQHRTDLMNNTPSSEEHSTGPPDVDQAFSRTQWQAHQSPSHGDAVHELNLSQDGLFSFDDWNHADIVMAEPRGQITDLGMSKVTNAAHNRAGGSITLSSNQRAGSPVLLHTPTFDEYLLGQLNQRSPPHSFSDHGYEQAKANMVLLTTERNRARSWFPSRYMVARFVKAFFEHMAPHLPLIHEPTFDIATVSCKLMTNAEDHTNPAIHSTTIVSGDGIRCTLPHREGSRK